MNAIYSNTVSITLAQIIGDAILPATCGSSVEARHLDAMQYNPKGYAKIIENEIAIIATGNLEDATEMAKGLIA